MRPQQKLYLGKTFTMHWHQLCRTFLTFSSVQYDVLTAIVAELCIKTYGSLDPAAVVAKETDASDPPLSSRSLRLKATTGRSSTVAPDASVVCASVPSSKSAKECGVSPDGDLEATEFNLDLRPLEPNESAVAFLSAPN